MRKVLVIEDTLDARDLIKTILELEAYEVVLAADGVEGFEKTCAESPDLVITDIAMPRLNGIEMIRKLRKISKFRDLPIMAVTSHGIEQAMEAIRAGANRALARPVQNHLLLAFVTDLLLSDSNKR